MSETSSPSDQLRALCSLNVHVKSLYKQIRDRKYRINETTAPDLEKIANCTRAESIHALKEIERAGGGSFRKGRTKKDGTKHESRLIWDKGDPREHARIFFTDSAPNGDASPAQANSPDAMPPETPFETRLFTIRRGCALPVPVPADMTQDERSRYIAFIQSLYCREDAA
jgi:hypothetical protein